MDFLTHMKAFQTHHISHYVCIQLVICMGGIIEDHTNDIRQVIVLDSSTAKNVVIRYNKESKVCDDIKSF